MAATAIVLCGFVRCMGLMSQGSWWTHRSASGSAMKPSVKLPVGSSQSQSSTSENWRSVKQEWRTHRADADTGVWASKNNGGGGYDAEGQGRQINDLITKAVGLIQATNKVTSGVRNTSTGVNATMELAGRDTPPPRALKPVRVKFTASNRQLLNLKGKDLAIQYLSLPTSEYALLDTSLVSRSRDSDDTFFLSFPLGQVASALAYLDAGR